GLEVSGDGHMLISAIANLVQNGLKFTHAGGTLTVRAASRAEGVYIEVEDECGGLSPELLRRLREPEARTSTDPKGLGFGLRIAYRAVAAHGGHIEVRDLPGQGCVFCIELPRHIAPAKATEPERFAPVRH
ncbi:MAG: sensor histidine kinase, partial [Myxococcaceae bacterium]|nr:sensor histidine kinase [Myxococcaceae bacterium]